MWKRLKLSLDSGDADTQPATQEALLPLLQRFHLEFQWDWLTHKLPRTAVAHFHPAVRRHPLTVYGERQICAQFTCMQRNGEWLLLHKCHSPLR